MIRFKTQLIILLLSLIGITSVQAQEFLSLAGSWSFQLDSLNEGEKNNWQSKQFSHQIYLPGTTDEGHYGFKTSGSDFGILTRAYKYCGPAWYQQEIMIPRNWNSKRVYLQLERVIWQSKVFVDGKKVSVQDALNSPHWHDLGFLSPGKHTLAIRIDNDTIYNIGDKGHAYTEYTQSIWNGAVGKIRLVAKDKIRLSNPQLFTKVNPCILTIKDTLCNESGKKASVLLRYQLIDRQSGDLVHSESVPYIMEKGKNLLNYTATMPRSIRLWNDISPNLYILKMEIVDKDKVRDSKEVEFGFREVSASKSKILLNGKPVFLRGNLDCVHFPLTGYPSCKVEDWERIFRIYKDYGLNHVRFHSWCPPEAAFIAANRIGIYIQAETIWIDWWMSGPADRPEMETKGYPQGLGKNPTGDIYVQNELERMVQAYGNNPSFIMMCIGNELGNSDFDMMEKWMKKYHDSDKRRLYSTSTARKIMPSDQFIATHYMDKIGGTRGIKGGASLDWDFEEVYSKSTIPVLSHEIGQWPVYPRWSEIKKYTGVLKARNMEEFRLQARKNNLEEQNEDFVRASGALNQIMYKYEIESFLRTPSCAGIQLLSLQDYQGQGEALVGWLDVFYDSKGITTPEKFRSHHDSIVPLLRLPKFVWKNEEAFTATVQLAHYGDYDITDAVYWKIKDELGNVIDQGTFPSQLIKQASSDKSGVIRCELSAVNKASKLTIEVGLAERPIKNTWNIWVYPAKQRVVQGDVYVTDRFDAEAEKMLHAGKSVLLDASALGTDISSDPISFYPLYWSLTFFPGQGKNTIGMLVRDNHPALAQFPSDYHSDWQWQSIYKNARAFYLNDMPENYKPIAQPVDDFHRNNKLGAIFEMKVARGKLLISGFSLKDDANPVTKQLKHSLLSYMNSQEFNPEQEITIADCRTRFSFVEPVKSEAPKEFAQSILYIKCASKQKEINQDVSWSKLNDAFEVKKGTDYIVTCDGTWKDEQGAAWQGKDIRLEVKCPAGVIGSLYVFFHDWSDDGRKGLINFEGRDYKLNEHNGKGQWVKLHVMREDSNDGVIVLKAKATSGPNLMISQVAFVEE